MKTPREEVHAAFVAKAIASKANVGVPYCVRTPLDKEWKEPAGVDVDHSQCCDALTAAVASRDRDIIERCAQEAIGGLVTCDRQEAAARIRALAPVEPTPARPDNCWGPGWCDNNPCLCRTVKQVEMPTPTPPPAVTCAACEGRGYRRWWPFGVPVRMPTSCGDCNGTGALHPSAQPKCPTCGGKKRVARESEARAFTVACPDCPPTQEPKT